MGTEPKDTNSQERPYFEIWGEALNRAETMTKSFWIMAVINLCLLGLLKNALDKPPMVIRVSQDGKTSTQEIQAKTHDLTEAEVKNFAELFLGFFLGRNSYTSGQDLKKAFSMMTPEFREKAQKILSGDETEQRMKQEKIKTELKLKKIKIEKDSGDILILKTWGSKEISAYDANSPKQEIIFEGELVLKKTQRSIDSPYGLLTDEWNEQIYKD